MLNQLTGNLVTLTCDLWYWKDFFRSSFFVKPRNMITIFNIGPRICSRILLLLNWNVKGSIQSRVATLLMTSLWSRFYFLIQHNLPCIFHICNKFEAILYITLIFVIPENDFEFRRLPIYWTETWMCQEDVSWATDYDNRYFFFYVVR